MSPAAAAMEAVGDGPPELWPGPVPGSYRIGYVGPGVPMYSLAGSRQGLRERWERRIRPNVTLTATCHRLAGALAYHGDRDGTHIYPSQKLLADELGLSTGTVSKVAREGEDAGLWQIKRSRFRRSNGQFGGRKSNNYYILCVPPDDAEPRGIRGCRKRRHGSPADVRRAAQERRRAETLARLAASVGEEEAQRLADSKALGAFRPARNDPCPCGSGVKSKTCCGADRGPGGAGQLILGGSPPPSPPDASEPTSCPTESDLHQVSDPSSSNEGEGGGDEGAGGDGQAMPVEDRANPWAALKEAHRSLFDGRGHHGP